MNRLGKIPIIILILIFFHQLAAISAVATQMPVVDGIDDIDIEDAVLDELFHDQVVMAHWIDVNSEDGVVTFTGRVDSLLAKERSTLIAGTIKGVRGVINMLEIIPPVAVSDRGLVADVKAALLSDPATDLFEIEVNVSNGVVKLSGTVDSWQEKKLCAIVVKDVIGVKEAQNDIRYEHDPDRSDKEIQEDIEQAITWDCLVDGDKVEVVVLDKKVTISGSVGSLAEKRRIVNHAFLADAEEVDATKLDIAWWLTDTKKKDITDLDLTDQELHSAVQAVLFHDPRVSQFHLVIEVKEGVVTLRGTVDNLKAKRAATLSAQNTIGVEKVVNRLKVRPVGVYQDAEIKAEIRESLSRDPFVRVAEITIAVHAGVVELSGAVNTAFQKIRAEELAMRVNGVVGVNNHLVVGEKSVPFPYDPYLDDWYAEEIPSSHHTDFLKVARSDTQIAETIKSELFWSPFVDSDSIHVAVEHGVATLTGSVDSRSAYRAATQNAYQGGALRVENELKY